METSPEGGNNPTVVATRADPELRQIRVYIILMVEPTKAQAHDCRHAFASMSVNEGASLYQVQLLLGYACSIRQIARLDAAPAQAFGDAL